MNLTFGEFLLDTANGVYTKSFGEMHGAERTLTILKTFGTRGVTVLHSLFEGKVLQLTGEIIADDSDDLIALVRNFVKELSQEGQPLIYENIEGIFVYDGVYVTNTNDMVTIREYDNQRWAEFRVVFLCPKGFARTTDQFTISPVAITSLPYTGTVTITGDTNPEPIINVTLTDASTITDIYFTNITTNQQISVSGLTLVDGDIISFDTEQKQVLHNNSPVNFDGVFPDFIPGENDYQLTAAGAAGLVVDQQAYNSEVSVYDDNWLSQSFQVTGAQSISQIGLLTRKVTTPQTGSIQALVVAGGGGGGGESGSVGASGGGGAGGYLYSATHTLAAQAYAVTVGAGGGGGGNTSGDNGENSVFNTFTAIGGGKGTGNNGSAGNGGSGGGGRDGGSTPGGTGTAGQGYNGGSGSDGDNRGGGGGGAAGAGVSGTGSGAGGAGASNSISGAAVTYSTGGGGGTGSQGASPAPPGSGGGGGSTGGGTGAAGRAGIVIIKYITADFGTCTGGTITTDGIYTIHTFTSNGTFVLDVPIILADLSVSIQPDTAGSPSGTPVTNGSLTIEQSLVGTSFSDIIKQFTTAPSLSGSTTYHLVIKQSGGDISNYYVFKKQNTDVLANGNIETSLTAGASWTEVSGEDLFVKLWGAFPTSFILNLAIKYFPSYFNIV